MRKNVVLANPEKDKLKHQCPEGYSVFVTSKAISQVCAKDSFPGLRAELVNLPTAKLAP